MQNLINIHNFKYIQTKIPHPKKNYIEFIQNICLYYKMQITQIDIILLSDMELHNLNYKFLAHDTYTDIITFPYHNENEAIWTDIYISYERMIDNASKYKVNIQQEWLRLLAHGILHIFGFNDKTLAEQKKMRAAENYWIEFFLKESSL